MNVVKSFSDVRKELEKIANQRKHFSDNSKLLREEMINPSSPQKSAGTSSSEGRASSSSNKSYLDRKGSADISYGSPVPRTHTQTMTTSPGQGTASSVIGAFRQLQAKARRVEQERLEAMKERDDLRRHASENLRIQDCRNHQSEEENIQKFNSMMVAGDHLTVTRRGLELELLSLQEVYLSTQRSNSMDRAVLLSLGTEIGDIRAISHTVKCNIRALEGELTAANKRCAEISACSSSSPSNHMQQLERLQATIVANQHQIDSVRGGSKLTHMRCDALERYMELVLKINGDLTQRVGDTAEARERMSIIAEQLMPLGRKARAVDGDRYSTSLEGIINKSDSDGKTRPSAASRAKAPRLSSSSDLLRGKEESSRRDGHRDYLEGGSRSCTTPDVRGVTDLGTTIGTEQEHHQGRKERIRRTYRGRVEGDPSVMGSTAEVSSVRFDLDTAYRALSVDPRLRSSMNQLRSSLDAGPSSTRSHQSARSSSEWKGRNTDRIIDSNTIRQVRCRGSSALSTGDFRARNNKAFASASGIYSSHSAPASPSRSRDIPSNRNSRSSQSSSSQTGGYEKPTFIAKHSDRSESLVKQATAAALSADRCGGAGGESARRFIPGGNTEGKEFNVVAQNSKVSRAATHHNAAVAARYCRQ